MATLVYMILKVKAYQLVVVCMCTVLFPFFLTGQSNSCSGLFDKKIKKINKCSCFKLVV